MKNAHLAVNKVNRAFKLALLLAAAGYASAPLPAGAAEPLALKKIMVDLGRSMQTVTEGIFREDHVLVERAALEIANHPEIPEAEIKRLEDFLGRDMHKFELYDRKTHDLSVALADKAKKQDGRGVIRTFQKLQSSCLGCHTATRKRIVDHFYGAATPAKPAK